MVEAMRHLLIGAILVLVSIGNVCPAAEPPAPKKREANHGKAHDAIPKAAHELPNPAMRKHDIRDEFVVVLIHQLTTAVLWVAVPAVWLLVTGGPKGMKQSNMWRNRYVADPNGIGGGTPAVLDRSDPLISLLTLRANEYCLVELASNAKGVVELDVLCDGGKHSVGKATLRPRNRKGKEFRNLPLLAINFDDTPDVTELIELRLPD